MTSRSYKKLDIKKVNFYKSIYETYKSIHNRVTKENRKKWDEMQFIHNNEKELFDFVEKLKIDLGDK